MKFPFKNRVSFDPIQDYGINIIVRKYLCIPKWLPLMAFMEHGWTALDGPLNSDLAVHGYPLMFVYNKRRFEAYKNSKHNCKKIIILGMPFILYRINEKISKISDAIGTIVFPSHSSALVKSEYDIKKICLELLELKSEFHPITICLHHEDMFQKETYTKFGFKVVTAGNNSGPMFYKYFYNILREHKYACSNVIGSYTFYSIDLNIPFFLLGEEPIHINHSSKDINVPSKYKINDFSFGQEAYGYFNTGPVIHITEEQRKYVERETGIQDSPGRIALIICYWLYFFQWMGVKIFRKIIRVTRKYIMHVFSKFENDVPLTPESVKKGWIAFETAHYKTFSQSDIIAALNENSVCIDCGANIGNITHLFVSKGATVYSFEPHPMCFEELTKKFANNPKVHLINKGVLDKNQTVRLYNFKYHNSDELFFSQGSSVYSSNKEIDINSYDEVEVIDLANFIENLNVNIDILKMDVEGAEFCILDKLIDKKLYNKIKHILVETHDNEIPELKEIAQNVRNKIKKENITNIDLSWV